MNPSEERKLDVDALLAACRIVSSGMKPTESISELLEILVRTAGLDKARILLPDEEGVYKVNYHYGLTAGERKRAEYQHGEGITGRVALTKQIAMVPDIKNEPRFLGKITDLSIFNPTKTSFIALPIQLKNHKTGVLAVNRLNADTPVLESDMVLLQLFTAFVKQALDIHDFIQKRTGKLQSENAHLKERLTLAHEKQHIVSANKFLLDTLAMAKQSAKTDASVLILGESGTGKERFSQFIHENSYRNKRNFVAINCAAIPDSLMESELFGHEKGAFTGADRLKVGKFEAADGGTLFLDEIGDMNSDVQSKLLRVLQESEITRLGSNNPKKVDVRIIAATHQSIQDAISEGRFRLDLYYRLNVITLKLPALRERKEDIPLLLQYFLDAANKRYNKQCYFTDAAVTRMKSYHWPGNIRQLENLVERCLILSSDEMIDDLVIESGLTDDFRPKDSSQSVQEFTQSRPYQRVSQISKEQILQSLTQARGNKTQAAKNLGMSARQLQYRIKKLNIQADELV